MCATCPWRDGSPYAHLANYLEERALGHESRICHSTGNDSAIYGNTGKREKLCRGARNAQLQFLHAIRFLDEPTDAAWTAKCREMGIEQDRAA
jgi:hypothetical protein